MTPDYTPLLEAWGEYRKRVIRKPMRDCTPEMAAFFCGAAAVVKLIDSAGEQGGTDEATRAFQVIETEVDAFLNMLQQEGPRH